jgi:hypothetical protein
MRRSSSFTAARTRCWGVYSNGSSRRRHRASLSFRVASQIRTQSPRRRKHELNQPDSPAACGYPVFRSKERADPSPRGYQVAREEIDAWPAKRPPLAICVSQISHVRRHSEKPDVLGEHHLALGTSQLSKKDLPTPNPRPTGRGDRTHFRAKTHPLGCKTAVAS